ncbi:MAG: type II toxin-antitoxin system RelE/ParE family toxin [Stellaceae bacterium]
MEIIWRRAALRDLESLRTFIAQDNPQAAARVARAIRAAVERLAEHPNLGRAGRVEGTRELIITDAPYIVAYRIANDRLRILALIHASRQWPRRL